VLLWTRITSGLAQESVTVSWVVATDPDLTQLVDQGETTTGPERDFTVKVLAQGLSPSTTYYYRFVALGKASKVGRTRTLPVGEVERLRLGIVSCANWPSGFFNTYALLAQREDLDAILHLGDYVYEYANGEYGDGSLLTPQRIPMPNREIVSLSDYRVRHAQYKTDPDLQECHRQHPFIAIWDDHEFADNAFRDGAENHQPETEGSWADRKAAAQQAYFEWMPIRGQRVYRRFQFGDLMDLILLDTRLIGRDKQASGPDDKLTLDDPNRSLLGSDQEQWLFQQLRQSQERGATWRILGQQVMFGQLQVPPGDPILLPIDQRPLLTLNVDQWDGYAPARDRVVKEIQDIGTTNLVVLTGDIHSSWGQELSTDPYDPAVYNPQDPNRVSLGVEFVCPGITSPGIPDANAARLAEAAALRTQPHLSFANFEKRGYILLDIDDSQTQAEWYFMDTITERLASETLGGARKTDVGTNRLDPVLQPSSPKPNPPKPAP
jgi:alkaline phosphatase D